MKVINFKDLPSNRVVEFNAGVSRRIILKRDGLGFGLTRTTIMPEAGKTFQHYKNHQEVCYCEKGLAILTCETTGKDFWIKPGDTYILDKNDPHTFEAIEETVLICAWNPPLIGNEIHKKDGSYSLDGSNE